MPIALADHAATEPILRTIRDRLEEARRAILREIRNYPTPIAGCDVQFNGLMEQRAEMSRALKRLDAIGALAWPEQSRALAALIDGSRVFDEASRRALVARLRDRTEGPPSAAE